LRAEEVAEEEEAWKSWEWVRPRDPVKCCLVEEEEEAGTFWEWERPSGKKPPKTEMSLWTSCLEKSAWVVRECECE
jgi:hypothetical protein